MTPFTQYSKLDQHQSMRLQARTIAPLGVVGERRCKGTSWRTGDVYSSGFATYSGMTNAMAKADCQTDMQNQQRQGLVRVYEEFLDYNEVERFT